MDLQPMTLFIRPDLSCLIQAGEQQVEFVLTPEQAIETGQRLIQLGTAQRQMAAPHSGTGKECHA